MKKEQVTQFDLETAFKELDAIEIPKVHKVRPNRMNISESVKRVDRTSMLIEEYYDLNRKEDLEAASEEREAEIAKAKLARIEKIVDLDAETEDDVLPTYVGKTIVQCPQCMTLYYRNPEDLTKSDEDDSVVNIGEQCPNCGHADGFTVIGKVAAEEPAPAEEPAAPAPEEPEEAAAEEPTAEEPAETPAEEAAPEEEQAAEKEPELEPVEIGGSEEQEASADEGNEDEGEKKNESLEVCEKCGKNPCECVETEEKKPLTEDADLNAKLKEHNEYIEYLQKQLEEEEKELSAAKNEEVKASIQRKIDSLNADLEAALPEAVKADLQTEELPAADEIPETEEPAEKKEETKESLKENATCEDGDCLDEKACKIDPAAPHSEDEAKNLDEATELQVTDAAIDDMLDSKEFTTPISDAEVRGYLGENKELKEDSSEDFHQKSVDIKAALDQLLRTWESLDVSEAEDLDEKACNEQFTKYLTDVYQNVESFKTTDCRFAGDKMIVEGTINFRSGKQKPTKFEFTKKADNLLEGFNHDLADGDAFQIGCTVKNDSKSLIIESLSYDYSINGAAISGKTNG